VSICQLSIIINFAGIKSSSLKAFLLAAVKVSPHLGHRTFFPTGTGFTGRKVLLQCGQSRERNSSQIVLNFITSPHCAMTNRPTAEGKDGNPVNRRDHQSRI
jgi:hypothetical protein